MTPADVLRFTGLNSMPHFTPTPTNGNPCGGFDCEIAQGIAKTLGVALKIVKPQKGGFGRKINGTWNGLIGTVLSGDADMAMGAFINIERFTDASYTDSYMERSFYFVSPAPQRLPRWQTLLLPLNWQVWAFLISCILIAPFVFNALVYLKDKLGMNTQKAYRSSSRVFLEFLRQISVESSELLPSGESERVLFSFWMIFALVMINAYRSVLPSLLVNPPYKKSILTLDAMYEAGIPWGTKSFGGSEKFIFYTKDGRLYNEMVFKDRLGDCFTEVADGIFICFQSNTRLMYWYGAQNTTIRTKLRLSSDLIYRRPAGLILGKNSPWLEDVNRVLRSIIESGLSQKWFKESYGSVDEKTFQFYADSQNFETTVVLTLEHVQAAFQLWLLGIGLSVVAFAAEILFSKFKMRNARE